MKKVHPSFSWSPHFQEHESNFLSFQAYRLTSFSVFTLALIFIKDEQDRNMAEKMLESIKTLHLHHQDLLKTRKPTIYTLLRSIQDHLKEKHSFEDLSLFLIHATAKGRIYIFQTSSSFPCWHQRKKRIFHLQDPGFLQRSSLRWKKIILDDEAEGPFQVYRLSVKKNDKLFLAHPHAHVIKKKKPLRQFKTELLSGDISNIKHMAIIGSIQVQ